MKYLVFVCAFTVNAFVNAVLPLKLSVSELPEPYKDSSARIQQYTHRAMIESQENTNVEIKPIIFYFVQGYSCDSMQCGTFRSCYRSPNQLDILDLVCVVNQSYRFVFKFDCCDFITYRYSLRFLVFQLNKFCESLLSLISLTGHPDVSHPIVETVRTQFIAHLDRILKIFELGYCLDQHMETTLFDLGDMYSVVCTEYGVYEESEATQNIYG